MQRELLIDISRLIWRTWTGRLPTGVDRVCLAYVEHFASQAQAVIQRGNLRQILTPALSDAIFRLIREGGPQFRNRAPRLAMRGLVAQRGGQLGLGRLYLNVGHTGLDATGLVAWAERARVRPVYLIHDLIPLTHPEFCRVGEDIRHHRRMANALVSARGIIGNSQATLDSFAAFAESEGRACPPMLPALLGGHPLPADAPPIALDRPYFVTLGTIEGRKNHALLLQLWRKRIEQDPQGCPKLVIIGQRGWEAQTALAMLDRLGMLAPYVEVIEDCDDATLAGYLRGARALLMPSFAEGYGLPVVEALGVGTPVIASDLPVFRELAGDLPRYCDPLDGPGWMAAIDHHLKDGETRDAEIARVGDYQMPNWAAHFAQVEPWLATL